MLADLIELMTDFANEQTGVIAFLVLLLAAIVTDAVFTLTRHRGG